MTNIINQLKHINQCYVHSSYDNSKEGIANLQYALNKLIELLIEKEEQNNMEQTDDW